MNDFQALYSVCVLDRIRRRETRKLNRLAYNRFSGDYFLLATIHANRQDGKKKIIRKQNDINRLMFYWAKHSFGWKAIK